MRIWGRQLGMRRGEAAMLKRAPGRMKPGGQMAPLSRSRRSCSPCPCCLALSGTIWPTWMPSRQAMATSIFPQGLINNDQPWLMRNFISIALCSDDLPATMVYAVSAEAGTGCFQSFCERHWTSAGVLMLYKWEFLEEAPALNLLASKSAYACFPGMCSACSTGLFWS